MTTMMPLSPGEGDGINLGTYTYTSEPRTIPFSGSTRRNSKNGRLLRGNNFVKDGMPQWDPYFAYARCLSRNDFQFYETEEVRQRREDFRKQLRERARVRRKNYGPSSVFQTNHLSTNGNNTSVRRSTKKSRLNPPKQSILSPKTGILEASEGDFSFQTTPRYKRQSQRPSISVATQVSEGERSSQLITSRDPVTAEIKALVANTIRECTMEIAAEAEADKAKMESLAEERTAASNGNENDEQKEEPTEEVENKKKDDAEEEGKPESEAEGGEETAEEDEGGGKEGEEKVEEEEDKSNEVETVSGNANSDEEVGEEKGEEETKEDEAKGENEGKDEDEAKGDEPKEEDEGKEKDEEEKKP